MPTRKIQSNYYKAYLLRLWRDGDAWHATLEDAHSDTQHQFASFEALFAFLSELVQDNSPGFNQKTSHSYPKEN
jgi:hypothetical protein